jgi:hypothetical protein
MILETLNVNELLLLETLSIEVPLKQIYLDVEF